MTARPTRDQLIGMVAQRTAVADRTQAAADLAAAANALEALLRELTTDDHVRPRTLATLGSVRRRQWSLGERPNGLQEAIDLGRECSAGPSGDRGLCLVNLGNALVTRGSEDDLDEAITAFSEAVALSSPELSTYAPYLMSLGAAFVARSRVARTGDDLRSGIDAIRSAIDTALREDPRLPAYRANLADALRTRFHRTFDREDIDQAVDEALQAVEGQPSAAMLTILGSALLDRCEGTADEHEVNNALEVLSTALRETPARDASRPRRLATLAAAFAKRAEVTDNPADFERAEGLLLEAARVRPDRAILVNLSAVAIRRAQLVPDDGLVDNAIATARGVDRANLATALHMKATRTGEITTLDEALAIARTVATDAVPGTPAHARAQSNLAAVLQTRHLRTGRGDDLDAAVIAARFGVEGTHGNDPELPGRLGNLGNALRLRGVRTRAQRDLDDAVRYLARAARLARVDQAGHLSDLGSALQARAEAGDGDPWSAILILREAVAQTPANSLYRPRRLSNLGNAMVSIGDPHGAVELHREALAILPGGHPDRAVLLGNLSNALGATGDNSALPDAIRATREVVNDRAASGQDRLLAAWRTADLEVRLGGGNASCAAGDMRTALDLAQRAAWLGSPPADHPYTLTRFSSLALDAAAALGALDPAAAVEALEAGRAVGWREQLQQRRIDALADRAPALADRLRSVGVALDRSLTG